MAALDPELAQLLEGAWETLQDGIREPQSNLRTPVMATVDRACHADARTVVVERIDPAARTLYVNTDRRSPKVDQLRFRPEALFVFCNEATQVRLRARVAVHCGDAAARRSWAALPATMRAHYVTKAPPGTPAAAPSDGLPPGIAPSAPAVEAVEPGFANYALLAATAIELDWLLASPTGRRRATFSWTAKGTPVGVWVLP